MNINENDQAFYSENKEISNSKTTLQNNEEKKDIEQKKEEREDEQKKEEKKEKYNDELKKWSLWLYKGNKWIFIGRTTKSYKRRK